MNPVQLELLRPAATAVSAMDLDWMMNELRGHGWRLAADIGAPSEAAKRKLRAIAKASKGEIISGQQGYRLTREANHTEYLRARAWMHSQAEEMQSRVAEIDTVWSQKAAQS